MPRAAMPQTAPQTDFPALPPGHVMVGRLGAPHGVRGWLRLHSFTDPPGQLRSYLKHTCQSCDGAGVWQSLSLRTKDQGNGALIACAVVGEDRELARQRTGWWLAVPVALLPELASDEYYWHQLEGLEVWHDEGDHGAGQGLLGCVECLHTTGANDVLVVRPCVGSIDSRRRLLPWVPGQVVRDVDLVAGRLLVEWNPEF